MKKILAIFLVFTMVLALCGCGTEPTPTVATDPDPNAYSYDGFSLGFAMADITPEEATPLGGYGVSKYRISTEVGYEMKVSAMALTGSNGETLLVIEGDVQSMKTWADDLMIRLVAATGLSEDQIFLGASHTHCMPDMNATSYPAVERYRVKLYDAYVQAAQEALADRKPCEVYFGQAETEGMNFVRHYYNTAADGTVTYFGDNFGQYVEKDSTTKHAGTIDPTLHVVKFVREGERDLLLCNFRAHPAFHGASSKTITSSDYIGAYREAVTGSLDCDFIYMQGAAGNVNHRTKAAGETHVATIEEYAAKLLQYTEEALQNMTPVEGDELNTIRYTQELKVDHSMDHLFLVAKDIQTVWNTNRDIDEVLAMCEPYGISSPFHAGSIVANVEYGETGNVHLGAFSIGENLGFIVAPFEMFCELTAYIEDNAPYEKVITMCYAYKHVSYLPTASAFEYHSYESDCFHYEAGSGELIRDQFLTMLEQLKEA